MDIAILNKWEKEIVVSMALLPCRHYSIPELAEIFQVEKEDHATFFDTIHDLSTKGYFERGNGKYGLKGEVCESIIESNLLSAEQCSTIINYFSGKLENSKLNYEKEFLPLFTQLESLLSKIKGRTFQLAQLSYLLSSNFMKFKKFNDALKYNELAIKISKDVDEKHPVVALFYRDKALLYKFLGEPDKAILYSLKDIEILEKHAGKYDDLLPDSYFSLSKTYEQQKNYEKAVEYSLKAIRFESKRKRKRSLNLSGLYHNLAYYYIKLNNLENASISINKAVESFNEGKSKNENHYKILLRDQKRFNSLFEFEQFILKYKKVMLILAGLFLGVLVWAVISLLGN
jgi:tetratricopeptide (TPR) repeat protein